MEGSRDRDGRDRPPKNIWHAGVPEKIRWKAGVEGARGPASTRRARARPAQVVAGRLSVNIYHTSTMPVSCYGTIKKTMRYHWLRRSSKDNGVLWLLHVL